LLLASLWLLRRTDDRRAERSLAAPVGQQWSATGAAGRVSSDRDGATEKGRRGPPRLLVDRSSLASDLASRSIVASWVAQSRNKDARHPIDLLMAQLRSEPWAGAMEKLMSDRFSRERLEAVGLTTMALDEVDCRESACRLEISWADADVEVARKSWKFPERWPDAQIHLTNKTGGLATLETRARPKAGETVVPDAWHVRRRDDGRYAVTTVVLFGEEDIDPNKYNAVIERAVANRPYEL
jgi:hypothetical protein